MHNRTSVIAKTKHSKWEGKLHSHWSWPLATEQEEGRMHLEKVTGSTLLSILQALYSSLKYHGLRVYNSNAARDQLFPSHGSRVAVYRCCKRDQLFQAIWASVPNSQGEIERDFHLGRKKITALFTTDLREGSSQWELSKMVIQYITESVTLYPYKCVFWFAGQCVTNKLDCVSEGLKER